MQKTHLVVGGSRGIGLAVAHHLEKRGERVISVSRTPSAVGTWIEADISKVAGIRAVHAAIAEQRLDGLLYMGGTWETNAFTRAYRFEECPDTELERVLNVNLLAPIRLTQALLPALRRSDNPKILFMGSLSGRDNYRMREVANTASKFGLRGVVDALRRELFSDRIGVSIINPGSIATPEVLEDLRSVGESAVRPIPMEDLLSLVDCILNLSRDCVLKEADLLAMSEL